jgi:hypothetical protein
MAPASASAVTSEQLSGVQLRDDLQRSDPPSGFSSFGMGAGKWSLPTSLAASAASIGGAWNSGGRLGYGSPGGWAAAYWNAQSFKDTGNGVAVVATLTAGIGNGEAIGLWLNMPSPTTAQTGYELFIIGGATANQGTATIYKWTNGSATALASGTAVTNTGTTYALVEKNGEVSAWGRFGGGGTFLNPPPFQKIDPTPQKEGYAVLQVLGGGPTMDNFSVGPLAPARPILISTSPASPNPSLTPSIIGIADTATTVNLYTNSSCSGKATATGTAAAFNSSGISVSVEKESTTTFYASVTNSESVVSACSSSGFTYVNDSTPPAKPTLGWTDPTSPGAKTAIHVGGSAESGSTVKLYKGTTCSGEVVVSGTASTLAGSGLAPSVSKGTTSTFSATATDTAGNVSPCSNSIAYVEDSAHILYEAQHFGDFNEMYRCNPERTTEVADPLGSGRTVLDFTVFDTDTKKSQEEGLCTGVEPTNDPRTQGVSPAFLKAGDEFWLRAKFLIPESFPALPKGGWMTLVEPFGPPFTGSSPWRLEIQGENFIYERNTTYKDKEAPWTAPVIKGSWVEILTHERFDEKGWLEFWFNGSPVKFFGETFKLEMATRDSSNNGGNNSFRIGQYRKAAAIKESASLYYEFIKVGTSKASVGG